MYDFQDEALQALVPKAVSSETDTALPEALNCMYLTVSPAAGVMHVGFKEAQKFGEETVNAISKDFARLLANLDIDSKVLLDFSNVESVCDACIAVFVHFSESLRHKGSRVVLCCLDVEARKCFFPRVAIGN